MKKKLILSLLFVAILNNSGFSVSHKTPIKKDVTWLKKGIETASFQLKMLCKNTKGTYDTVAYPRSVKNGEVTYVNRFDWTSGFFPGSIWYGYELTGDKYFLKEARYFTNGLEKIQYYTGNHDIGFMMYCSFGNALRLAPKHGDNSILINSSKSLISRYNTKVGLIRSWDFGTWKYPVIIDNMMNLELLFWASKKTNNPIYKNIAISHADKTLANHFRENMSTYHVVSYEPNSGKVESKGTFQGYADSSSWARGQAWALYGYTVCYRETKNPKYLKRAQQVASYIMNNPSIPSDKIPYWDYNAPKIPNEPRDASAAAITASALLELYRIGGNKKEYFNYAEDILKTLSSDTYLAQKGENNGYILKHSVGSFPHTSEVDVPLNYADYYYLEGLQRYIKQI